MGRSTRSRRGPAAWLALLILAAGGCAASSSDETLTRIDDSQVMGRLTGGSAGRTLVIDARPADAYRAGHIPSAVNLRLEDVARGRTSGLENYPVIIVYGDNPASSVAVAMVKRLRSLGHRDVRLFEGGFDGWRRAGRPVARDE
ncbi:MAG: hypothetical protein D6693_10490 [Planctomycetota bacterium]|nr:MAG: hypothetical protein D6693_10490 [Planctomycetota bacterium]